ncbi:MAG: MFS transporter [Hyphomicrobium sp.]
MSIVRNTGAPRATLATWIGLAVIAIPCLLYAMDLTVLALAVPQITQELSPTASELLWIMDVYGFMVAGFLVTMGTLGDRIGRRRLLMWGAAAFGIASVLVALSTSAEMLIAARALQGIAGATLAPSTLSLIRNMFLDDRERTLAVGVWVASFSAGAALGPVLGGLLLEHFHWGAIFLITVPVMLLLLVVAPRLLPEFRDPDAGRMDVPSAVQSLAAVLPVIYGIKRIAEGGPPLESALAVALGLVAGALFVRRQARLADPMIDVRLLRTPGLRTALAINILGLFTVFATFLFIAQYLQLVLGMGPLEAGLWTAPSGIVFALGSIVTPFVLRHASPASVLIVGFVIAAIGFAMLTQLRGQDDLGLLFAGMIVLCIGLAPVGAITTDLVLSSAPPERAGAASAISETSFEFGAAAGIAVLGSVFTAVYRLALDPSDFAGVSPAAATAARESLGGAMEAVRQLPFDDGQRLTRAAREAFALAFAVASALSAACALGAAALSGTLLRRAGG